MHVFRVLFVAFLLSVSLLPVAGAAAPSPEAELIVAFDQLHGLSKGQAYGGGRVVAVDAALRLATVQTGDPEGLRERARHDPHVRYVEINGRMRASALPNDPHLGLQYAVGSTRLEAAWNVTTGSASARVCVADTGLRATHEDVAGRVVAAVDLVEGDDAPQDENGHGTHVATIAAATAGNGRGVAGVAQASVLAARVLAADGSGAFDDVASGIRWCADRGAHVLVLSLGAPEASAAVGDAIRYAVGKGALVVAAAGNDGPCADCVSYPARDPDVLAVGCTDAARAACAFTSSGPEVDLAAPGAGIVAAWPSADDAYARLSGTSMSAPFVGGLAALLKSHEPALDAGQLRARLLQATRDAGPPGPDPQTGAGEVDAGALFPAPAPAAPPPPSFNATFGSVKGNEWWIEARVAASEPLSGVDARVNGGAWVPLAKQSWGAWAKSVRAPANSIVQLQARSASGAAVPSACYKWAAATVTTCPGAAPAPANNTTAAPGFDATFTGVKGNAWWIEAKVASAGGTLSKVEASVNGGAWKALALRSWGAWAVSTAAPEGSVVRLRATSATGAIDLSGCYRWTAATPTAC